MLTDHPPKFRRQHWLGRRIPPPPAPPPPPPVGLTLVSAAYVDPGFAFVLTFDRPIDIAGVDVTAFFVNDAGVDLQFQGYDAPSLEGPNAVRILINGVHDGADPGVWLTAGAGNGITSAGAGGNWGGATHLALPWP